MKKLKKDIKVVLKMTLVTNELLEELTHVMGTQDLTETLTKLILDRAADYKISPIDETAYAPVPPSFDARTRPALRKDIKTPGAPTVTAFYGVFKSGVGAYRAVVIDGDGNRRAKHFGTKADAGVAYDEMASEVWGIGNFTPNNSIMRDPLYLDKFEVTRDVQGIIDMQKVVRTGRERFVAAGTPLPPHMTNEHFYDQVDEFYVKGNWPDWLAARRDRGLDLDLRRIPVDAPIIYPNWTRSTRQPVITTPIKTPPAYPTRFDDEAGYRVAGVDDEASPSSEDPYAAKYTSDGLFIPRRYPLGGPHLVANPLVPNPLTIEDKNNKK